MIKTSPTFTFHRGFSSCSGELLSPRGVSEHPQEVEFSEVEFETGCGIQTQSALRCLLRWSADGFLPND
jgi:hypothetical protein